MTGLLRALPPDRGGRLAGGAGAGVLLWLASATTLPHGVPFGVVVLGLVLGSLSSLTALGLVLVYRSARIVNFAQAEIGGLAASLAVIMVAGERMPYWLALLVGLVAAVATGWLIDVTVIRRFFTAPRLILTVATIGLAQILGAVELGLPSVFTHLQPLTTFTTPFRFTFRVGPIVFTGDHLVAILVVPLLLGGLAAFFTRSDTGIAVRAAADSTERALLLGIPVRRLSRVTWMLAAGLSGIASMLSAPIVGPNVGGFGGAVALLAPLTAAVIGRMENLTVTVLAALGIGVFEQVLYWNYPRSSVVDVGLFLLVLGALMAQRKRLSRVDDGGLGSYIAVREVRPVPQVLARLPEVRLTRAALLVVIGFATLVWPMLLPDPRRTLFAAIAIYGVIAVSLVVLTGWAGQISLGQFAFAGVGAATAASLLVHENLDMFLALASASLVGALVATLVGIPALRISGLFLAVATLAFGVPVSSYVLNYSHFPALNPSSLVRPAILQRIDLESPLAFYYFCLVVLAASVVLARNYRQSRPGRALVAVRDNERGAAAYAIEPFRIKLSAFALSGALAGMAGGLYALLLRGIPFSGYSPTSSLIVFTMVVIGGVASIPGALLGAVYVEGTQFFLRGAWQLLATGAGLVLLLMVAPGGLGEIVFSTRDWLLRRVARRRGLSVPSVAEIVEEAPAATEFAGDEVVTADGSLIRCEQINASYGQIQVLFDVNVGVRDGEILALLGTNGAGKSTVLRVIAGLLHPRRHGRVVFEGRDITGLSAVDRVRAGLVTVPGGRGVFSSLTVEENLRLGGWIHRDDREFLESTRGRIFELFPPLADRLNTTAAMLSGGEQQMLTLAQAMLCRPRLLMIDELSLGLAPAVVADLLRVVREINADGTTVVVVEQSVNIATELAERAVFMEKGQVRFTGATSDLVRRPDLLRSIFLRSAAPAQRPEPAIRSERPAAATAALQLAGVTRSFGGVTAVSEVSLDVADGEILGIIGANGAGKTTLFDLCSGYLAPDRGAVRLGGADVTGLSAAGRAERGMGRSFQDARLFPSMTVSETIATALERHVEQREPVAAMLRLKATIDSEREVRLRVEHLLETMHLTRYRDAFVSELSTGTRRIVELACAIAHEPRVLLLDEPSSGIAQRESEALAQTLLEVRERTGAALVVIEHDIPLVTSIADRLVCLHLGRVVAEGPSANVLADPTVVASYLGTDPAAIERSQRGVAASTASKRRGGRVKALAER
jgi:ABC-type branched-subunit amino acid transport system ATPase component/ABC-type branched-subunit amino acid transport system permease subunit